LAVVASPAASDRGAAPQRLYDIGARHGTDKAGQRQLLYVYEEYFEPLRATELVLVEIGVLGGASLRMWREYLPRAQIFGIDVDPEAVVHADDRITVLIGSQSDTRFLDTVLEQTGRPDIVLDDGSHHARDQITTLLHLWRYVRPGGIYVVEDIHTSYMPEYNMGWRERGTTMEFLKDVADDVNGAWHDRPVVFRDVYSLAFFQELCILRKRREAA
jgi:trans-aconitate methyltransferase